MVDFYVIECFMMKYDSAFWFNIFTMVTMKHQRNSLCFSHGMAPHGSHVEWTWPTCNGWRRCRCSAVLGPADGGICVKLRIRRGCHFVGEDSRTRRSADLVIVEDVLSVASTSHVFGFVWWVKPAGFSGTGYTIYWPGLQVSSNSQLGESV